MSYVRVLCLRMRGYNDPPGEGDAGGGPGAGVDHVDPRQQAVPDPSLTALRGVERRGEEGARGVGWER